MLQHGKREVGWHRWICGTKPDDPGYEIYVRMQLDVSMTAGHQSASHGFYYRRHPSRNKVAVETKTRRAKNGGQTRGATVGPERETVKDYI